MKILIIKLSSFGDIIHCFPVLTRLRALFPDKQIDWLLSGKFADLLIDHKDLSTLYTLPKNPFQWGNILDKLCEEQYDYALDLQGLIKTSIIANFIQPKEIIGLSPARERIAEWFWTKEIESTKILDPNVHVINRSLEIVEEFEKDYRSKQGLDLASTKNLPQFNLVEYSERLPAELINQRFIVFAPESRWQSKNWPIEYWQSLINELIQNPQFQDYKFVILGSSPNPFKIIENNKFLNLSGKTSLKDLMGIVPNAELVIGSDSGIIHLASAYNVKTLGIYGSTSPMRSGPWNGEYLWLNLKCSPCHQRQCPLIGDRNLNCLLSIQVNDVLNKIKSILKLI